MKQLSVSDALARKIFPTADQELKAILVETYGEAFFKAKITDRVKTFADACNVLGINSYGIVKSYDSPDEAAYKQLKVIVQALNEGWTPDWNNDDQYKYYPWFNLEDGFRFDCVYSHYCADSHVGSRLCFKSSELAEYAAKQFTDLYKQFFTI